MAKPGDEKQRVIAELANRYDVNTWPARQRAISWDMTVSAFDAAIELAAQRLETMAKADAPTDRLIGYKVGADAIRALKGNAQGAGDAQGKG